VSSPTTIPAKGLENKAEVLKLGVLRRETGIRTEPI